jgi:hypothetical protein
MHAYKGSGIICVLLVTGGILTLMSLIVRYTTYGVDIAHQRVRYEQRYFALKGLLNYGVMVAEQSTKSDSQIIEFPSWLSCYAGKVIITPEKDIMHVDAYVYTSSDDFVTLHHELKQNFLVTSS